MPVVTVIITTYNLEKYIAYCLNDLIVQTMKDFDVLVIDDCSKDKTVSIIQRYLIHLPGRIRLVILPQNLGSAARTRNYAMDSGLIKGEYLIFLDGDDRIEPDFLESLYEAASQHRADVAVCSYDRIDSKNGNILCEELQWLPDGGTLFPDDLEIAFLNGAIWNKLIRRKVIGQERIPDIRIGEDVSYALKIYRHCHKIACVRRMLIHYRVHPASAMLGTGFDDIRCFADELANQFRQAPREQQPMLALVAYLHIVLSMTLRAAACDQISLKAHHKWLMTYCQQHFNGFTIIQPSSLVRITGQRFKGNVLRLSLFLYKKSLLLPAIKSMRRFTQWTGKDIKW